MSVHKKLGCPICPHIKLVVKKVSLFLRSTYILSPAAARRCNTWRWLVVGFSAKQKQQLHHQQLTNGSTILKTFTFPVNLDLFNLSTVSFGSVLANILSDLHTRRCLLYVFRWWCVVPGRWCVRPLSLLLTTLLVPTYLEPCPRPRRVPPRTSPIA